MRVRAARATHLRAELSASTNMLPSSPGRVRWMASVGGQLPPTGVVASCGSCTDRPSAVELSAVVGMMFPRPAGSSAKHARAHGRVISRTAQGKMQPQTRGARGRGRVCCRSLRRPPISHHTHIMAECLSRQSSQRTSSCSASPTLRSRDEFERGTVRAPGGPSSSRRSRREGRCVEDAPKI